MSLPTLTKRRTLAQVLICLGCCCGRTDRGRPAVPVDWLKAQWKQHKLLRSVHLSISGCLGPCDAANVVGIVTPLQTLWLGGLTDDASYRAIFDWALRCAEAERVLPLPPALTAFEFERFQTSTPALSLTAAAKVSATDIQTLVHSFNHHHSTTIIEETTL